MNVLALNNSLYGNRTLVSKPTTTKNVKINKLQKQINEQSS
jgi:hypothetical protein